MFEMTGGPLKKNFENVTAMEAAVDAFEWAQRRGYKVLGVVMVPHERRWIATLSYVAKTKAA